MLKELTGLEYISCLSFLYNTAYLQGGRTGGEPPAHTLLFYTLDSLMSKQVMLSEPFVYYGHMHSVSFQ